MTSQVIPVDASWVDAAKLAQIAESTGMKLECPVCLNLLNNNPHDWGCAHGICFTCIAQLASTGKKKPITVEFLSCKKHNKFCCHECPPITGFDIKCPNCRKPATHTHALFANAGISLAVGMLKMTCPCGKFTNKPISEYIRNHYYECPEVSVACPYCTDALRATPDVFIEPIKRKELTQHVSICPYRKGKCEQCKEIVLVAGHETKCPNLPVPCTQKCGQRVERKWMSLHITHECETTLMHCPFCNVELASSQLWMHFHAQSCASMPILCKKCKTLVPRMEMTTHICPTIFKPRAPLIVARRKQAKEEKQEDNEEEEEEEEEAEDVARDFSAMQLQQVEDETKTLRQSRLPFRPELKQPPAHPPIVRRFGPGGGQEQKTTRKSEWIKLTHALYPNTSRPKKVNVDVMVNDNGTFRKAKVVLSKGEQLGIQFVVEGSGIPTRTEWMLATCGRIYIRNDIS